MVRKHLEYYFRYLHHDIPAGTVVFLVALPLNLGVALASGAPLVSGLITGIISGLVVAWASGSQLSISGLAAGLSVIVVHALEKLGSFEGALFSVAVAGILQMVLGFLGAGTIAVYFPSAVIKGMLAAIGLILIMKQIPHAVGYDADFEGDESYLQADTHTTFTEIGYALQSISPGAITVSLVAIAILLLWESRWLQGNPVLSLVPGPLVAVLWGIAFNLFSARFAPAFAIAPDHWVQLPAIRGPEDLLHQITFPDFTQYRNLEIYSVALTLALVASLETLLSLEAIDKIDPWKRVAPTGRELKAQGFGNLLCGLIGGLPMTAVIVRGSANVAAGARTKMACFVHGVLLLLSVMFLHEHLNLIPLSALAAILLLTGYRLANLALFRDMYRKGFHQLAPFLVTIGAILVSDLLKGMAIGMACGLYFIIRTNFQAAISMTRDGNNYLVRLHQSVSFLNKPLLRDYLSRIEENSCVLIDGSRALFIDHDILETIHDFVAAAGDDNITVELKSVPGANGR